jgi:hypothetical protein
MTAATADPSTPVTVLEGMRAEAAGLVEELWSAKRPGDLLDVVTSIEKLKSTLEAVEHVVIDEIQSTGAAKVDDWASTKDFVTAVSGGTRGSGPRAVRTAKMLTTGCRATLGAMGLGWLSLTKAQIITGTIALLPVDRQVRAEAEETLLELARGLDAHDLMAAARHVIEVVDPDGDERRQERALSRSERAAHLERFLSVTDDDMGGVQIKGRTSVEDAAIIKAALMPLTAPRPTEPGACGGDGA